MKEVLYVISGKRLPVVFHVGARALTSQALNIHAGHDDVMAVADTGLGDRVRAERTGGRRPRRDRPSRGRGDRDAVHGRPGRLPDDAHARERPLPEDELLRSFVGDPHDRIRDLFDPSEALMTGVVQNQDSYMKGRIGQRAYTDRVPGELAAAMAEWTTLTGRRLAAIDAYRCSDASEILVAMGTIADTAIAVVDHLRATGSAGRLRRRHLVPAVPGRGARARPSAAHGRSASWSERMSHSPRRRR